MRITSFTLILALSCATLACGPRNTDKLEDNELATAAGGTSAEFNPRCTAQAAQDEVRRQLFARAAEIRGSNGDNYARIAEFAVLQLDGATPVAAVSASELMDCRGHATLRLPAGLKVAGGRTVLGGDIGYSVSPGGRGGVTLGQSDSISIPLATLTQVRTAAPAPAPVAVPSEAVRPAPVTAPSPTPQPAPAPTTSAGRPSFDCRNARTAGENAVCDNPALAALDRAMSAQYRGAVANGDPEQRRLLAQTRNRFLGFRDRCGTDQCIANTYRGRMREIDDILAGRWRGDR